ncbi:hypothetical protein CHUAL_004587 [Chamberlinius hualienensis]
MAVAKQLMYPAREMANGRCMVGRPSIMTVVSGGCALGYVALEGWGEEVVYYFCGFGYNCKTVARIVGELSDNTGGSKILALGSTMEDELAVEAVDNLKSKVEDGFDLLCLITKPFWKLHM